MADGDVQNRGTLPPPFTNPALTAKGEARGKAPFASLQTLWVNTGTLCNIECAHCYIKSSPTNDALIYLTAAELIPYLEAARAHGAVEIGFTGGEPFMNPHMSELLEAALERGFSTLVLTNAMRPMMRPQIKSRILTLANAFHDQLKLRVSLDHYTAAIHDLERGDGAFETALEGVAWAAKNGLPLAIAGRSLSHETPRDAVKGYQGLFDRLDLDLDASDPAHLVIFPEMDGSPETPEITEDCWRILKFDPSTLMCATARMIVKRKGAPTPTVLACTLITEDPAFDLGPDLDASLRPLPLNHPHCSKFCVLGGATCSGTK